MQNAAQPAHNITPAELITGNLTPTSSPCDMD